MHPNFQPHWRIHCPFLKVQMIRTLFAHAVAGCRDHPTGSPKLNYPERGDVVVDTIYHVGAMHIHS